jgi:FkbM family methyltransferase
VSSASKPVRRSAALIAVAFAAFFLYRFVVLPGAPLVALAANGIAQFEPVACSWDRYIASRWSSDRFAYAFDRAPKFPVVERDHQFGIVRVQTPSRSFWLKDRGDGLDGPSLIRYLLVEHDWMRAEDPDRQVKPGEIVMDCGAHVGTFVHQALELGAARVVAVEPDRTNLECLRRNFAREIEAGQVVLYPKAVWDAKTTLKFTVSDDNSGMNTAVLSAHGRVVEVPATRIDDIVEELNLPRLDRIKLDVEGAERNALRGGIATLKRFRPRIVLEAYHLPDDATVLPGILHAAHDGYKIHCGPCEYDNGRYIPHVLYVE